jgi:RNA polymerase sigma-70 factor (ECF subfamily)
MSPRQVHEAIRQLPAQQRQLIELVYWKGCSASEVAAHLDIPLGTVRAQARLALIDLSRLLERSELQSLGSPLS